MDNTKENTRKPRYIGYCFGAGGIEIGASRVLGEMDPACYVEIEAYAAALVVEKIEKGVLAPAPVWTNAKTFRRVRDQFRHKVDWYFGGYPCQPFSIAGQKKGSEDPRHLWPHLREDIRAVQPLHCLFENVREHINRGFREVFTDLRKMGYWVEAVLCRASETGQNNNRERLFILATRDPGDFISYADSQGLQKRESVERYHGAEFQAIERVLGNRPTRCAEFQWEWERPRVIGYAKGFRWVSREAKTDWERPVPPGVPVSKRISGWGIRQPRLLRANDGLLPWAYKSIHVDRIRMIGKAVNPDQAEFALRYLLGKFKKNIGQ